MPVRVDSGRRVETIGEHLDRCGFSRREFLEFCTKLMVAAPFGLALTNKVEAAEVAREVAKARRPSVIWLHFQECTGCTETLLRTSKPDLAELLLHLVSVDYHETLMAAAGKDAEEALHAAMAENAGKYVLVVEGALPRRDNGIYMKIANKTGLQMLDEVSKQAAAIIAIGSCASWGGIPSADPNPTDAVGVAAVLKTSKPLINIPGCPPNPYNLLGTVLQYATAGTLPALDELNRPKFAYDRYIHDHCPRRPHFDAGRFAPQFGVDGHREGWCLYKLGCKGPVTRAGCSTRHFNEVPDVWPIGIGAPCFGCTEQQIAFRVPMFQTVPIHDAKPPDTYAPISAPQGVVSPAATAVAGLVVGAMVGAGWVASRKLGPPSEPDSEREPKKE
ncbi:MAG: hydrogenase (NiFe) small subunit (hydA) [Deltaproteobacteria bacterium]|nr:hydrogenase (NiFe) small subunit (hydA) [Deltaproteobacteria bacterium]